MIIVDEQPLHLPAIGAVLEAAFGRADEARLVERLRADRALVLSLAAIEDDAVIGHVAFSAMRAPFRALGLGPVAVAPARQRSGVGRSLIGEGLARARAAGWEAVFVLGDPSYYRRFGFSVEDAAGFTSPYAGPHFMALALGGPRLPASTGPVEYAPAFGAFS